MRCLLKQVLGCPRIKASPILETSYETHEKKGTTPKISELEEIFKYLKSLSPIYLVFDAFDECTGDQQPAIKDLILYLSKFPNVKIAVTSRPHQRHLEPNEFQNARSLEIKSNDDDVEQYLSTKLMNSKYSKGTKEKIMNSIKNTGTYLHSTPVVNFAKDFTGCISITIHL
jgi:hypothetical protein